jgi:transposase-like protein
MIPLGVIHDERNWVSFLAACRRVRQASQESGWSRLRQELTTRYHLTKESIRPRDEWLVSQLLSCNSELLARLETGERLTPQVLVEITDALNLAREIVGDAPPPLKALPWAFRLERLLLGSWEMVADEQVRCAYCGSTHVARKSNKPRIKTYYDEAGVAQTVEVYRFYCRNADCEMGSFTHLPVGLQLYSPYRVQTHLLAAQLVGWGQVNYRRAAVALGVSPATIYRWVTAGGTRLLPIAAIFGVVRSSGVIGVDEKYVLVPKNDKPYPANGRRTMRRWMYVSVAVDCYTCDLLHIAIYPYQNAASSRAFLLALRAKGYRPRVIVTDLLQSYDSIIASVFPHALHHECVFHALQAGQRSIKSVYGANYGRDAPQAQRLKEDIYAIFDARTRPTAVKRYEQVMSLQQQYVEQNPDAEAIFSFLRTHWPKLVNSIGSKTIPNTNNAAERLIRRFDQHYQNFCGFESLDSAQCFIAVFERSYRFTPFSQDAQAHIRGKCPLEVAGYDVSRMPLTAVAAGWSPDWPVQMGGDFVPNR